MGFSNYINNWLRHDSNTRALLREVHRRQKEAEQYYLKMRINHFRHLTLTCQEPGTSKKELCDHEVIVSLTSFGERIHDVHLAIESIMQGSIKPNRIILWLSEEEFRGKPLPATLKYQQQRGLEIFFCKDIRSYKKLIYSLQQNPESCIITIDDDLLYEFDIVERLINAHIANPHAICACRLHRIILDSNNLPISYLHWEKCINDTSPSPLNFATGCGGTLYPPGCLAKETTDENLFMKLCPTADDIWFFAMAKLQGTLVIKVPTPDPEGYFIELPSAYINALKDTNATTESCMNDPQMQNVLNYFNLYPKLR